MAITMIPETLSQMDGIFGCKVVEQTDQSGKKTISFQEKNFFEWVCDVLFDLHFNPVANPRALAALEEIADRIKDAETGDFRKLLDGYKLAGAKINFREVKKTLEVSLEWEFPPTVYSRDAGDSSNLTLIPAYKAVHQKNMKKAEFLEKKTMPLILGDDYRKVSDDNIRAYCDLLLEIYQGQGVAIAPEMDEETQIRMKLMAAKLALQKNTPETEDIRAEIKRLEKKLYVFKKIPPAEAMVGFARIYAENLRKIEEEFKGVHQQPLKIEMLVSSDGKITDENIKGLAKALVQIKSSENMELDAICRKFEVDIPEAASEIGTDIKARFDAAYMEARLEYFQNFDATDFK